MTKADKAAIINLAALNIRNVDDATVAALTVHRIFEVRAIALREQVRRAA